MRFFFIVFLLLFSCSKDKKDDLVDLNAFLKEGERIYLVESNKVFEKNVNIKKKILISNHHKYKNWSQKNYNSGNFIFPAKASINKSKRKISGNFQQFIIYKNQFIGIDRNSSITLFDKNLKKINSKKIYKRKVYKNYKIKFELIAYQNKLVISDNLGNIHCFNLENLSILWKKNFGIPFRSSLKIHKKNVYLLNSNSKLFSINIDNGKLNWSFETASKKLKHNQSYQIAIYKDKLFFTNDSAEIYCIDLQKNNIKWSLVFDSQKFKTSPLIFKSSPITLDNAGNLIVSSNYGSTYVINSTNGLVKWSVPIYSLNRVFIYKNNVFLTHQDRFIILDKRTGKIVFNKRIISKRSKTKVNIKDLIVGQNQIYILTSFGVGFAFDLINLNNTEEFKIPNNYENFLIYKNNIFIKTADSLIKF